MGKSETIAFISLVGVASLTATGASIASCVLAHRRKDPARLGFLWLKPALAVFALGVTLLFAEGILVLVFVDGVFDWDDTLKVTEAISRMDNYAAFFMRLGYILVMITTVEVGAGVLYCWDSTTHPVARWSAYAVGLVEFGLDLSLVIRAEIYQTALAAWFRSTSISNIKSRPTRDTVSVRNTRVAHDFIMFFAATAALIFTVAILVKSRKRTDHRSSAVILLYAAILSLISHIWNIAMTAYFILGFRASPGSWDLIAEPILMYWTQVAAMVMLLIIGIRKVGGLWSADHGPVIPAHKAAYASADGEPL